MAGVILILLCAANFGGVLRFIPDPVIAGFTAGIGVIIWVGQWKDFFGLPASGGAHFHEKLWHLLQTLPELHPATTLLALLSLLLAVYGPKIPGCSRVPGPMIAMVVATVLQATFHFDGVATISSAFGEIPRGLPHLVLPVVTFDRLVTLVPAAFTIAMLGAIESLLSAAVADGMAGTRHDSNQELIGQGIANVLTPFFGGFAATGAIARTATNYRNGATSPLAGIVHSITLVLILLLLARVAGRVPLAALAAILFFVAWNMSEARHFVRMVRRAPRPDVAILLITFLLTVFTDLVVAVNVGVILAMLLFRRRRKLGAHAQTDEHRPALHRDPPRARAVHGHHGHPGARGSNGEPGATRSAGAVVRGAIERAREADARRTRRRARRQTPLLSGAERGSTRMLARESTALSRASG